MSFSALTANADAIATATATATANVNAMASANVNPSTVRVGHMDHTVILQEMTGADSVDRRSCRLQRLADDIVPERGLALEGVNYSLDCRGGSPGSSRVIFQVISDAD